MSSIIVRLDVDANCSLCAFPFSCFVVSATSPPSGCAYIDSPPDVRGIIHPFHLVISVLEHLCSDKKLTLRLALPDPQCLMAKAGGLRPTSLDNDTSDSVSRARSIRARQHSGGTDNTSYIEFRQPLQTVGGKSARNYFVRIDGLFKPSSYLSASRSAVSDAGQESLSIPRVPSSGRAIPAASESSHSALADECASRVSPSSSRRWAVSAPCCGPVEECAVRALSSSSRSFVTPARSASTIESGSSNLCTPPVA
ncbi:hypothetical protein R3P38DRAFT_3201992 [Favolaschia claudopus]|uniref:Uncharacterized protein n=1 Tax=Favolaschia claudopus TaxID=2862362 RepID=A0AAW0AXK5_9AGAR